MYVLVIYIEQKILSAPVRDEDGGAARRQLREAVHDATLRGRVQGRGGLIADEQLWRPAPYTNGRT